MNIVKTIRTFFRKSGFDIVHYVPPLTRPFEVLPSIIRQLAESENRQLNVLQIGANDGVRDDPIHDSIVKYKMRGILVEPIPDIFHDLVKNYEGVEDLSFECAAITEHPQQLTMYRVKQDANVNDLWYGIISFNRSHLIKEGIPEALIESIKVKSITIPELAEKYELKELDVLQIDAEGFDHKIVKLALNSDLAPKVINYEHSHLRPHDRYNTKKMLDDFNYRFIEVGKDTLAVHKDHATI